MRRSEARLVDEGGRRILKEGDESVLARAAVARGVASS